MMHKIDFKPFLLHTANDEINLSMQNALETTAVSHAISTDGTTLVVNEPLSYQKIIDICKLVNDKDMPTRFLVAQLSWVFDDEITTSKWVANTISHSNSWPFVQPFPVSESTPLQILKIYRLLKDDQQAKLRFSIIDYLMQTGLNIKHGLYRGQISDTALELISYFSLSIFAHPLIQYCKINLETPPPSQIILLVRVIAGLPTVESEVFLEYLMSNGSLFNALAYRVLATKDKQKRFELAETCFIQAATSPNYNSQFMTIGKILTNISLKCDIHEIAKLITSMTQTKYRSPQIIGAIINSFNTHSVSIVIRTSKIDGKLYAAIIAEPGQSEVIEVPTEIGSYIHDLADNKNIDIDDLRIKVETQL